MRTQICISIFAMICLLSSCASSGYIPSPNGDYAEITFLKNKVVKGELLAVTDTMIFVESEHSILAIRNRSLKDIYFEKYSDYSWMTGVALLEVLPAVVFSITAASVDNNNFGPVLALALIPAAITTPLFALSSPKTTFNNFNELSEIYNLKKFARYPGGITERQLIELLEFNGQDSLIHLK